MSTFEVSHYHINRLLSWAHRNNVRVHNCTERQPDYILTDHDHLQAAAEQLQATNLVSCRAHDITRPVLKTDITIRYEFIGWVINDLQPVQVIKACNCYEYQACEAQGYWDTDAAQIVDRIRREAIRRMPGYEDAEWELKEPTGTKKQQVRRLKQGPAILVMDGRGGTSVH